MHSVRGVPRRAFRISLNRTRYFLIKRVRECGSRLFRKFLTYLGWLNSHSTILLVESRVFATSTLLLFLSPIPFSQSNHCIPLHILSILIHHILLFRSLITPLLKSSYDTPFHKGSTFLCSSDLSLHPDLTAILISLMYRYILVKSAIILSLFSPIPLP